MDNLYIGVAVILLIGFAAIAFVLSRSVGKTLYGRKIDKRMTKRNLAIAGFIIFLSVGMTFLDEQLGGGYRLFLASASLFFLWLQWFVAMYRQSHESEQFVYVIPSPKPISKWLIILTAFAGTTVMIIWWLTYVESGIILFIGFVLLFGSLILAHEITNQVSFTASKIYNGSERFEWDRIIWWSWAPERDNHRRVVVQLDGFWSSVDFRTIKVPVDRYEDVDQLFHEFTKNLKPEKVELTS